MEDEPIDGIPQMVTRLRGGRVSRIGRELDRTVTVITGRGVRIGAGATSARRQLYTHSTVRR